MTFAGRGLGHPHKWKLRPQFVTMCDVICLPIMAAYSAIPGVSGWDLDSWGISWADKKSIRITTSKTSMLWVLTGLGWELAAGVLWHRVRLVMFYLSDTHSLHTSYSWYFWCFLLLISIFHIVLYLSSISCARCNDTISSTSIKIELFISHLPPSHQCIN